MKYQRIKNITQLNIEETYDIAMKSPYNNFIANDIIVHNSSIASKVCKQVDPDNFSELCDISALIRPGTLSMGIPEIYSDRNGRADENNVVWSEKDIPPSIHHILKPTFGLMCITGDTKILTTQGLIEIKEIVNNKLEVKVLTLNENTLDFEWQNINKYYDNGIKKLIELEFSSGQILKCTPDHQIYTNNRGWIEAQNLNDEDEIVINEDFSKFA